MEPVKLEFTNLNYASSLTTKLQCLVIELVYEANKLHSSFVS